MSITTHERFTGYPCLFDAHTVNHVRSVRPSFGVQKMEIIPSGAVDRLAIAEAFREAKCDLVTGDLISLLTFCPPMTGYAVTAATLQFQDRADGGTFAGAGANITLTSPKGFLHIDEISAQQDSKEGAIAKLTYWGLTDGTNPPFTPVTGQDLTGSVAVNGLFKLSSVTYEGSKVLGVQSVRFSPGLRYVPKRSSGALYADVGSIVERRPMMEVRGTNLTLVSTVGTSLAAISTGLVLYFQQIGVAGAHQVSISITGGVYSSEGLNAQGTGDVEGVITADASGSGTVAYSTTASLP